MKTYINPEYSRLSNFINSIPEIFIQQGETIYDARNTIKIFREQGLLINIKSFKRPIFINRFAYKYIRKSKAERSFLNALEVLRRGIGTPSPIAYIETSRNGLLCESYYVSIHEPVDGTMKEIYKQSEDQSKDLIQAFTLFTAEIHQKGIFHKDYSPGNILYKKTGNEYRFYLVDLNRMSFKRPNILDSCKSFRRLRASSNTLNLIGEEYSKVREYDEKSCQKLIHMYNHRFWKKHLVRHPESRYEFQ
ncbi:lipopolysaccharide kinase InaA family protein [Dysgonomonas sp. OttesenSCG-928-D17]|nr:lipopolysaccharide kinase InaA family protein [Dysgonomonas sp. OttesenSCG-928-D17]